jgi:hypothetical protein
VLLVILGHDLDLEPAVIAGPAPQLALTIFTRRVCSLAPGMTSSKQRQSARPQLIRAWAYLEFQ